MAEVSPIGNVAMISLHTSPLDQPGTGDAGGMNVYVLELARRLVRTGVGVDVFTRATSSRQDPVVDVDGVRVHHVVAGPFEGLTKDELPAQLCTFAREVLRAEAGFQPGHYDLVHSHYWLSGQVGALARDRWGVPLVHTMHTMAKVKNAALAQGDTPEPTARLIGEEQVVAAADMLVANTDAEARQLVDLYDADPTRVETVHPGVDLEVFAPGAGRSAARRALGLPERGHLIAFVGRIQPLKAPDVVVSAAARLAERHPDEREHLTVAVIGGPSGSGLERPDGLAALATDLGIADRVRFVPPVGREELALWFAAADLVCVPSYNESFGLVAVEAQATGTPVVAAAVGGLTTAVADGVSGILVPGHDPDDYATAFEKVLLGAGVREALAEGARDHARQFGWDRTTARMLDVYARARDHVRGELVR